MGFIDAIKRVYLSGEDAWYSILDKIDAKIPVYTIIDKIDAVVPSFALFLILIFVIIILLIIILLSSVVTTPNVEAIVIVTSGGMPVAGADVMLASGCNGSDVISVSKNTNDSGEAIIEICADIDGEYQISVSKNNFNPVSKSVEIGEDRTIKINLDSVAQFARAVYAEISDEDGNPIEGLSVELVCISDLRTEEITPNEEDKYIFDIFEDCTTIQLRASAQGYETETENIGRDTERVEIIMQKVEENGSVIFEVTDSEGPIMGVEITLIDDVGKSHVLFTGNDGFAEFEELSPGRYNYTALDSETGRSKQNIIEVNPKETVEINIEFAATTPQEVDTRKKIYVKVVDDSNSPIAYANSVIFKDGNVLTQTKSTDSAGEIKLVVPDENSAYQISINRLGYQLTIVNIVLKSGDESPQIIVLKQGGGKINVSVVNEDFEAVSGSQLQLYLEGFSGYILSSTTDTNGQVTWENLPAGNYEILALKADSDGSATLTLEEEETKDVEIQMIIGRGEISFRLNDHESTAVDATNIAVYAKRDGAYNIVKEGDSSRSYFETEEEKHGTKVLMTIDDETYFPYESLIYTIYKGNSAEKKYIYLRETDSLPNENKVQMFLQQVYSTSPLQSGTATKATTLEPGERYYLLFNVILNPEQEETNDLIANFYVGPKDENVLVEHNPFAIQGVESVKGSVTIMSSALGELQINYLDEDIIVDEDAKQANLLADELSGPKQIPILVILDVDLNAEVESTSEIFFNAKWGDETSLDYEKEFEIGKTFCMGSDCPVFLFSNYIKWDTTSGSYEAITTENTPKLYIGDEYTLKTVIENLSDEDFKEVKLQTMQTSTEPKILFDGNASIEHDLVLSPLSQAAPIEMDIEPVDDSTSVKIKQQITKYAGATDLLEGYVGTENESRVKVYTKDQVKIQTALTTIYAGAEYPMFTLKVTNDSKKEQLQANWKVNKEGETALFNSMAGTTDVNGLDVIQLDASTLEDGDVLIFTAYSSGMLDGTTRVEVENRLPSVEPPVLECLSVEQEQLSVSVGSAVSFTINSDCDVEREVYIYTDQFVSDKQFDVPAKGSVSVSVTGTARDGILGVYPLQILSIDEGRYSQVGFVDIIVSQSGSCFSIDSVPIYDFQTSETAAGRITNNCFSGRKDIYYPQISFSTNSVSVAYQKDGVPETITLYPTVYGSAIESIIYGQIKADAVHVLETCGEDSNPYQYRLMPTELYFMEDVAEACEDYYDKGESTPKPEPEETEDLSEDPYNEYVESETVAEEGSSSTIIEDEEENGEFAASEKVDKLSFKSEVSIPADVVTGDYGEIALGSMPEAFSDICIGGDQCENQTMVDDEGNPIVDADGEPITGYSCADGIFSCSASEVNDMWGCCTAGQSRWGYHGSGYFMEYYYHFLKDLFGNQGLGAPRPPEHSANTTSFEEGEDTSGFFTWTSDQPQWSGGGEVGENNFKVILGSGHKVRIEQLNYLGDGEFYAKFQVKGSNYFQWGRRCRTAQLKVQMEMGRILEFLKEQRNTWIGEENISPIEGKVYDLGSYADAYPSPLWTNEETGHGKEIGDEWNLDGTYLRYGMACVYPNGFVNPEEHGYGEMLNWEIRDASDPLVEYDGSGNIMYWIPSDKVPEGVEMYLKFGHVWAKYNGIPQVNSPNIDLTFTKANLIGNEYAIITVKDWTGDEVTEAAFQVKLVGPPGNCFHSDGTEGFTGDEFSPNLLFDWDWSSISSDQCDYENDDYTYCDATQFTMALMRKLKEIDDLYKEGNEYDVGTVTGFHSYLIKDNYTQEFLDDFDAHYAEGFADTPIWFNTAGESTGFDKFISENKITFVDGGLPYAGLYNVSVDVVRDDESINGILTGEGANAEITVKFKEVQQAPNYNPFYDTPFDGRVGTGGARQNYGTSVSGTELKLNQELTIGEFSGSANNIGHETSNSLSELDSGVVLEFDGTTLKMNPAQPTPVLMTVDGTLSGNVSASYIYSGTGVSSPPNKTWRLIGSDIGNDGTCKDFEDQARALFIDSGSGATKTINWAGHKKGTLELGTIFYTPQSSDQSLEPANASTALSSKESLMNATAVMLNHYDSIGKDDYYTLKGIFEMVDNEELCMSKSSSDRIKLWWNPEKLDEYMNSVDTVTPGCN